ncbi:nucleotide sugar dehydrogenase [uncultured Prochlorococcus sp.]|uniref:nucleotide sugar dehydrogenase n=1 Tax=uncultured Prochlorococcus sp. TaxID=159733 RepID=UPI00258B07ED|nr:nucleotide sugar dehydrogenase [uncultured Prochlorococcus sp.]
MRKKIFKEFPSLLNCKITVLGMGYVGLPLAVEFAKSYKAKNSLKKFSRNVIGFDIDKIRIKELKNCFDKTMEIDEKDKKNLKKIIFTDDIKDIYDSDVFIVTVPTPIDSAKKPILDPLISVTKTIGYALIKKKKEFLDNKKTVIIYESTVFPGATEEICIPIITKMTGLKVNEDFNYGYSPERINPGDKVNKLKSIKKITSGNDECSKIWIDSLYSSIIEAGTVPVSSVKTAEAAKIIENTQRDVNIALINELALIFQKMGINTKDVIEAASTKWNFIKLYPGLVGGHCIGVDPYYLSYKSKEVGYFPNLINSARKVNDSMGLNIVKVLVKSMIKKSIEINGSNILIMGFSFKENCPDFRNTGVLNVYNELIDYECNVDIYDPVVNKNEVIQKYGIKIYDKFPEKKYSAILIAVGHKCFQDEGFENIKKYTKNNYVILDLKYLFYKKDGIDLS